MKFTLFLALSLLVLPGCESVRTVMNLLSHDPLDYVVIINCNQSRISEIARPDSFMLKVWDAYDGEYDLFLSQNNQRFVHRKNLLGQNLLVIDPEWSEKRKKYGDKAFTFIQIKSEIELGSEDTLPGIFNKPIPYIQNFTDYGQDLEIPLSRILKDAIVLYKGIKAEDFEIKAEDFRIEAEDSIEVEDFNNTSSVMEKSDRYEKIGYSITRTNKKTSGIKKE